MKVNLFTHSSHLAYQLRIKCSLSHKWMDASLKGKMILRHNICLGFFLLTLKTIVFNSWFICVKPLRETLT